jgi:hypothetical protein
MAKKMPTATYPVMVEKKVLTSLKRILLIIPNDLSTKVASKSN